MKKILSVAMALMFIFGATTAIRPISGHADAASSGIEKDTVFTTQIGDNEGELAIDMIAANKFTDGESGVSAVIANNDKLYVLTYEKTLCEYDAENGNIEEYNTPDGVLQYVAGIVSLTYHEWVLADVNGDGVVNTADSTKILQYVSTGSW